MKKSYSIRKRLLSMFLVAAMSATFAVSCNGVATTKKSAAASNKIVNIGVTDTLGSLNPVLIDATEINKYATAMMFLPLVELNGKMKFEGQLADSVTTKNNKTFMWNINKKAKWSDGKLSQQMMWPLLYCVCAVR